jgi:ribonuclease HI
MVPTRFLLTYQLPEKIICSDASSTGCGAILASSKENCFRAFSAAERNESSTSRELKAVLFALESFKIHISHKQVMILTDNQACTKIIACGSMKPHLQQIALRIFAFSIQNKTNLDARWIPREVNTEADALSKRGDSDSWAVRPLFFRKIDQIWGPHSFDRFADHCNAQLPSFNSRFPCPGSAGTDAFSFDWSETPNNWLVPPVHLITKTVQHLIACKAKGTLVCPKWQSAVFWPILFPLGAPAHVIKEMIEIPAGSSIFLPSSKINSIFNKPNFPSPILFLRLDAQLL